MPAKKINLPPDVKSRLRQAVLGGISPSPKPKLPPKPADKPKEAIPAMPKPAAKILKKIVLEERTEKSAEKTPLLEYKASLALILPATEASEKNKREKKRMIEPKLKAAIPAPAPLKKKAKAAKPAKSKPRKKTAVAKMPLKPEMADTGRLVPPFSVPPQKIKPSGYKPFATAKRDWEKPQKEESLEKLFSGAAKKRIGGKDSFWKFSFEAKPSSGKKHLWLKLIGAVALLAALLFGYVILGIYKYGFSDAISIRTAKTLSLPAGLVDGSGIGAGDYLDNMKFLAQPLAMSREGLIDYSGKSDLSDRIFYRLAANKLAEEKLRQYGKSVSQSDIDNQVELLLKQTGGQTQAETIIRNLYGFGLGQFKGLVLLPMMARANLQTAIIGDESLPITQAAKGRADEVLKIALASSTDFNALAKQYTDDESSVNTGGDLGWVVKGQLDQSWESVIFSAATGTVVTQPIKSGFGFHIVKVEQKLIDKATGAQSVKLRHILIRVDVDKYIKELLDAAKVVKYIN